VICSQVGALVNVNDFIGRESRALTDGGTFATGKYHFRYCRTPHLPHGWDASVLFEETQRTLLCSDLFHLNGDVEPLTSADVVGRSHQALKEYQAGILAEYVPYTPLTAQNVKKLADLKSKTLAIMHGSSFTGDCASKRVPAGLHNCSKSLLPSSVNWTNCPMHLLSLRRRTCCNAPQIQCDFSGNRVNLSPRQLPQLAMCLANSRALRLCVHPFDPLSAKCGSHERICKILCFARNLVVPELHDAHGVGRLAVICQDEFGDPKMTTANDSSDSKPLFARLTRALALYVESTVGSLA
jgi:hypothetical protein